jgi:DNA polymerase-3 subunit epsilon
LGTNGGFAVLDLETTGFGYKSGDRIVEIGVVFLSGQLENIGSWSTLLNPDRDPGPIGIHGIREEWLKDAPSFRDIYRELGELIEGKTLVAHNALFDIGFLISELERIGVDSNASSISAICTLKLAKQTVPRVEKFRLNSLAFEFGLPTSPNHSALTDAQTTAELLTYLLRVQQNASAHVSISPFRSNYLDFEGEKPVTCRPVSMPREVLFEEIFSRLTPSNLQTETPIEYMELLERQIQCAIPGVDTTLRLYELAETYGISAEMAKKAHHELFVRLVDSAWSDGQLTPKERAELESQSFQLGISVSDLLNHINTRAPDSALPFGLRAGDSVVLTGDMMPPKAELERLLSRFGISVKSSVSGKTSFVVAADPQSLSGKARRARELGIPIYLAPDVYKAFSQASAER